jgi:RimJ/RimL family protein N-acetyltransferase
VTAVIETERLELVTLDAAFLARWLAGEHPSHPAFTDPAGFLTGAEDVVGLRLQQLAREPQLAPWLLRAIVGRDGRVAVGFIGCHGGPDADHRIEIGYEVLPFFRNRGYAREATEGLLAWAAGQGVRIVRASVAPTNAASLAVLAHLGFTQTGEQIDPDDGLELVLEKQLT